MSLEKVSKNLERAQLLSQGVLSRILGKLEKFLRKSAKILKRLNYYPNEISDDP